MIIFITAFYIHHGLQNSRVSLSLHHRPTLSPLRPFITTFTSSRSNSMSITTTTTSKYNQSSRHRIKYMGQMKDLNDDSFLSSSSSSSSSEPFMTSTSEFVTHFIAKQNNTFTIEQAISSVLPRPIPKIRKYSHPNPSNNKKRNHEKFVWSNNNDAYLKSEDNVIVLDTSAIDMSLWNKQLYDYEKDNPILQSIDSKFRHDPVWLGNDIIFRDSNYDDDNDNRMEEGRKNNVNEEDQLSPAELVALGSVWFLPFDAPKDPSLGTKVG